MTLTLLYKVTNYSFTHRWQSQLCRVTASWSGAVKVRSCSVTPQRRDKLATFRLPVNPLYLLLWDTGLAPVSQFPWPNAFCSVPVPKRYKNSNMSSNVTQESLLWPHQHFPACSQSFKDIVAVKYYSKLIVYGWCKCLRRYVITAMCLLIHCFESINFSPPCQLLPSGDSYMVSERVQTKQLCL